MRLLFATLIALTTLALSGQPAECRGNCSSGSCVFDTQCGALCSCIVPSNSTLGSCAYTGP